jgi:hypothetical protein
MDLVCEIRETDWLDLGDALLLLVRSEGSSLVVEEAVLLCVHE